MVRLAKPFKRYPVSIALSLGLNAALVLQLACQEQNVDPLVRNKTIDVLARHIGNPSFFLFIRFSLCFPSSFRNIVELYWETREFLAERCVSDLNWGPKMIVIDFLETGYSCILSLTNERLHLQPTFCFLLLLLSYRNTLKRAPSKMPWTPKIRKAQHSYTWQWNKSSILPKRSKPRSHCFGGNSWLESCGLYDIRITHHPFSEESQKNILRMF